MRYLAALLITLFLAVPAISSRVVPISISRWRWPKVRIRVRDWRRELTISPSAKADGPLA